MITMLAALCLLTAVRALAGPTESTMPGDPEWWTKNGFVELVPSLALPGRADGSEKISVWVRVPAGAKIRARQLELQERSVPSFPPGTVADRVDSLRAADGRFYIRDVRGTRVGEGQEQFFHVFMPRTESAGAELHGLEWKRGSEDQLAATRMISERSELLAPVGQEPKSAKGGKRAAGQSQCIFCHGIDRAATDEDGRIARQPTDDSGFILPLEVLADRVVLATHRPWDRNFEDKFVKVYCGNRIAPKITRAKARKYNCPASEVPVGVLDMKAALGARDSHALAVCASRRYLFENMDDEARNVFRAVFSECGLGSK